MDLLLQTIRSYVPLSAIDEGIVRELFRQKVYQKGEHLLQAGQVCRSIIFIGKGLVRYYVNNDGEEKTNYFNQEGQFVCDYTSFLPQAPSSVNIQALEETTIWAVSSEGIQRFYREVGGGERFGRLAIEQVFVSVINQVISLYTDPPEVRYRKFLSAFPDLGQRIPQYYIASYVGVKPQSLSRIRKRIAGRIN